MTEQVLGGFMAGAVAIVAYHLLLAGFGWRFVHRDQMLQKRRRRGADGGTDL